MAKPPFGFDAAEDSPGFLLWQTTITWQRLIKNVLDPFNISHAQFVILAVTLWFETHQKIPTQITISRQSKLDKMTVSKSLKKLVTTGFIKRAEHATDTRAKSVRLTTKGHHLVSKLIPLIEHVDAEFFGTFNNDQQQTLLALLNKLVTSRR